MLAGKQDGASFCSNCGAPTASRHRFCGGNCRKSAKNQGQLLSPEYRLKVRQKNTQWAVEHRGIKNRQPWLLGAPVYGPFLPGAFLEVRSATPLKYALEHHNVRGLHGVITDLTKEEHDPDKPRFSLVPWYRGIGWGVYFSDACVVDRIKGTRHACRLYDQDIEVHLGGAIRLKTPQVKKRGRRRLQLDTLTQICTRVTSNRGHYTKANAANILSTLCAWTPRRLDLEIGADDAKLEIIENQTHASSVQLGGKYGSVVGWSGSLVIECNAVTEWLLRVSEVIGLGARCAFGFGRIKITEAP